MTRTLLNRAKTAGKLGNYSGNLRNYRGNFGLLAGNFCAVQSWPGNFLSAGASELGKLPKFPRQSGAAPGLAGNFPRSGAGELGKFRKWPEELLRRPRKFPRQPKLVGKLSRRFSARARQLFTRPKPIRNLLRSFTAGPWRGCCRVDGLFCRARRDFWEWSVSLLLRPLAGETVWHPACRWGARRVGCPVCRRACRWACPWRAGMAGCRISPAIYFCR